VKISLRPFGVDSGACDIFIIASERPFEGLSFGLSITDSRLQLKDYGLKLKRLGIIEAGGAWLFCLFFMLNIQSQGKYFGFIPPQTAEPSAVFELFLWRADE
jgi:hypothetical protein